jgi:predicted transcriptional regulator YdeE
MNVEIIDSNFHASVSGFSGIAVNNNHRETGFRLMNKMWEQVRAHNLPNKGLNIWVYEENSKLFAGVELENVPPADAGLEFKSVNIAKYTHYKHIGPYHQIGMRGAEVLAELQSRGKQTGPVYIEIYGHWTND